MSLCSSFSNNQPQKPSSIATQPEKNTACLAKESRSPVPTRPLFLITCIVPFRHSTTQIEKGKPKTPQSAKSPRFQCLKTHSKPRPKKKEHLYPSPALVSRMSHDMIDVASRP